MTRLINKEIMLAFNFVGEALLNLKVIQNFVLSVIKLHNRDSEEYL